MISVCNIIICMYDTYFLRLQPVFIFCIIITTYLEKRKRKKERKKAAFRQNERKIGERIVENRKKSYLLLLFFFSKLKRMLSPRVTTAIRHQSAMYIYMICTSTISYAASSNLCAERSPPSINICTYMYVHTHIIHSSTVIIFSARYIDC